MNPLLRNFFSACICLFLLAGCGRSPDRLVRDGLAALNAGDAETAAGLLADGLEEREEDASAAGLWSAMGLARARAGRPGPAEDAFRTAAALAPEDHDIHYNYGALLMTEGRFSEAIDILDTAARAAPDQTEALEMMAAAALNLGDRARALRWLTDASRRREHPRVLTSRAALLAERGEISNARDLLRRALDLNAADITATLNLAALLDGANLEPTQALHYYQRYLMLTPNADDAQQVRERMRRLAARAEREGADSGNAVSSEIRGILDQAKTAAERGDIHLALNHCLRAANAAERRGRPDLQEEALRTGARLAPADRRAPFALGRFLAARDRHREAVDAFRESAALAPEWIPALLGKAASAVHARQPAVAREALGAAEPLARDDPDTLHAIALLHLDGLNDREAARRLLQTLEQRHSRHPRTAELRGRLD